MKSHCGPYVLGNKTRCMACVTSMFIGLRETELLIEIFNKSSASFLLLSQMAEKLWCSGKKKQKQLNMICINFLAIHCLPNVLLGGQFCSVIASRRLLLVVAKLHLLRTSLPAEVLCHENLHFLIYYHN